MSVLLRHNCLPLMAAAVLLAGGMSAAVASDVEGFTEPNRVVAVAAADSAILVNVLVSEGAQVTEGQALATLDDSVLQATLAIADQARQARGRLDSARADLRLKTELFHKLEQLRQRKYASQEEVDRARVEQELAEAQILTVQEELALRELEYRRTVVRIEQRTIRSPLSGTIVTIDKQAGEFVSPISPVILSIAQFDPLLAVFSLPSDQAHELKPGTPVEVTVSRTMMRGSVQFVSPQIEPQTGTVQVKISIPNAEGSMSSGERCRLHLTGEPHEVAEFPRSGR